VLKKETQMPSTGIAYRLFDILNEQQIVYCHWKSNELLAQGLTGETDLDVLVDRNSFTATIAILLDLGFKQGEVRWGSRTPGVLHFYAFDPLAVDLIHVHLYNHLLTGESLVKTHVLPCEAVLLTGCERIGNIKVPTKAAEAALCVLRSCIKNGSLLHTLLHGSGRSADEPKGIDAATAFTALQPHYNAISEELFTQCFQALAENKSALHKWRLGLKVRRCLRGCARHTYLGRLAAYSGLVFAKLRRIVRGKIKNKIPCSGGAVIAFIGGDATGKSTLVGETTKWLKGTFAVRTAHVGKPRSTWLTAPLGFLLPLARSFFPGQRHQAQQAAAAATQQITATPDESQRSASLLYAVRAVSLAWDRSQLLRKVHRQAAAGEIVICDRYPADEAGGTDGPRLRVREKQSRLVNYFARIEQRLYRENAPPDIALRLHVSMETAQKRNQARTKADKHSDSDLELRHMQVRAWKKTGTKVLHDIDTEASLDQTILSVKEAIWESL
jgi:thymidylate kinase